jgi:nucleoid-associated protein YgaU
VRRGGRLAIALALSTGIGLVSAGCGKPVLRVADASLGDYYTDKEYKKLREDQRLEYCEELAEQDSIYREEIAEAREDAARYGARTAAARAAADSLSRLADSLEAARTAVRPPAQPPAPPTAHAPGAATAGGQRTLVRPGDSLWRISARDSVYGDGRRWNRLFEANRNRIRRADRIYPGQELTVPR